MQTAAMSEIDEPTAEELAAFSALAFDERVHRIVLVRIRGREVVHLGLAVDNPFAPLPRSLSYRGTLADCLTEATTELEDVARRDEGGT